MPEFKFSCPVCQRHLAAEESWRGLQIQCPSCQRSITIPTLPGAAGPSPNAPAVSPQKSFPLIPVAIGVILLVLGGLGYFFYMDPGEVADDVAPESAEVTGLVEPPDEPIATDFGSEPGAEPEIQPDPAPAVASENLSPLRYVHPEAEGVFLARVDMLWNSRLIQRFLASGDSNGMIEQMKQKTGFSPADLESIIAVQFKVDQKGPMNPLEEPPLLIFRTKVPHEPHREKLLSLAENTEPFESGQHQLYRLTYADVTKAPQVLCFVDATTVLLGQEGEVQRALQPDKSSMPEEWDIFYEDESIIMALFPSEDSLEKARGQDVPMPAMFNAPGAEAWQRLADVMENKVAGFTLKATVTDALSGQMRFFAPNAEDAVEINDAFAGAVQQIRDSLNELKAMLPPPLIQALEETVSGLEPAQRQNTVSVNLTLPASLFSEEIMGLFAMGMMGGGPQGQMTAPGFVTAPSGGSRGSRDPLLPSTTRAETIDQGLTKRLILSEKIPFGVKASNPSVLVATLEFSGPRAEMATAYGAVELQAAWDSTGRNLQLIQTGFPDERSESLIRVDPYRMRTSPFHRPEPGLIRIFLLLQRPGAGATHLSDLNGSLQFLTGGRSSEVTVERMLRHIGTSLSDPVLRAANLRIRLVEAPPALAGNFQGELAGKEIWLQVFGPVERIGVIELVSSGGQPFRAQTTFHAERNATLIQLAAEKTILPSTSLRLEIVTGQEKVQVPFAFRNVPLPQ